MLQAIVQMHKGATQNTKENSLNFQKKQSYLEAELSLASRIISNWIASRFWATPVENIPFRQIGHVPDLTYSKQCSQTECPDSQTVYGMRAVEWNDSKQRGQSMALMLRCVHCTCV